MRLQERLDRIREGFEKTAPPDVVALAFEILRDAGNAVAESYGMRWRMPEDLQALYTQFGIDVPGSNGDDSWTPPPPARYILDPSGVVRYARTDPDYTRRPEPEETLAALRRLRRRPA